MMHERVGQTVRHLHETLGPGPKLMLLKGALLSHWYYETPEDRPFGDVDVLVLGLPPATVTQRLLRAGYKWREFSRLQGASAWTSPSVKGLCIDVHFQPLPRGFGQLDAQRMLHTASVDEHHFACPIYLPEPTVLVAHLLCCKAKDRYLPEADKYIRDALQVARIKKLSPGSVATMLEVLELRRPAWCAIESFPGRAGVPWLADLQTELRRGAWARCVDRAFVAEARKQSKLQAVERLRAALARSLQDRPGLSFEALLHAAREELWYPVLNYTGAPKFR